MKLNVKTPQLSLSKDLLRFRPSETAFKAFIGQLAELQQKIDNKEREDQQKTYVQNFLRDAFYRGTNDVNSKGTIDLAIHKGATAASPVEVIIETKAPGNKAQMVSAARPNVKAMHELVLYFMRERVDENNIDLKFLIATNINEWFIFSASDFNRLFYENKKFKKTYQDWRDRLQVSSNTDHFYDEIVRPFIAGLDETIDCAYFDLREYRGTTSERKLISLFKILSPYFLLKRQFADDSNTPDKRFYAELLHIIGLEEYKEKSKTLIRRKTSDNTGSLLEMAVTMLDSKDVLSRVANVSQYGATRDERLEAIALELCITWVNRILFLKLLEAQLVNYHEGDAGYRFLNLETIPDFDELFALFHQVLAKTPDERKTAIQEKFSRVPYLNSSLFEESDLEKQTITIESLKNNEKLPVISSSIFRKIGEKSAALPTLEYLFRFLDAYDFASEGKEEIQKENRSLINASVLGKVFEKINGYKDGSIYTPGFITMYMCRQAIRLAVVQKFKDETDFDGADFDELTNWIGDRNHQKDNIRAFNAVIDGLKICDPAVGSGHFLVSALNEMLAIKSELKIFADHEFKRFGEYAIDIVNDELIITDRENNLFEYKIRDGRPLTDGMQRLQSTLFHEKQKLIENCLFGVDINPNSVKICRLRLWIELLKNAYYKGNDLETLPNIDINIKEGNSLVSRFALEDDLANVLKQVSFSIDDYRSLVRGYKETRDREAKRDFETQIKKIKDEFKTQLFYFSPERKKLANLKAELKTLEEKSFLFGEEEQFGEGKTESRYGRIEKKKGQIEKQALLISSIEENAIYKNAFEWRFEFPEVLNNLGNFLGFDVIIGNPPYINAIAMQANDDSIRNFLKNSYKFLTDKWDIYIAFIELGINLSKENAVITKIIPNAFVRENYSIKLREHLIGENFIKSVAFYEYDIFEVTVKNIVVLLTKNSAVLPKQVIFHTEDDWTSKQVPVKQLFKSSESSLERLLNSEIKLGDAVFISIGMVLNAHEKTAKGEFTKDELVSDTKSSIHIKRYTEGKWIDRYEIKKVKYLEWGTKRVPSKIRRATFPELYEKRKILTNKLGVLKAVFDDSRIYCDQTNRILVRYSDLADIQNLSINNSIQRFGDKKRSVLEKISEKFDLKFILSLLNSKLYGALLNVIRTEESFDINPMILRQLPIPEILLEEQTPFIELVDRILELKKSGGDTTELENRIDQMVYTLYDLTPDEIAIIEGKSAEQTAIMIATGEAKRNL